MEQKINKYLISALLIGLVFHGAGIFFTLETTYDALIHVFFANHYENSWFEPWNYSWYTGFTVMGYPPLVHQSIALLAGIGGLKFGLFAIAIIAIILFITGVYRFSLLVTGNRKVAGFAAILCVFSSSFVETLHLFGQLPSIIGISVLLHALPEIYLWLRTGKYWYLLTSFSLLAVTVTSHHVTPIFGMIFFIFPLIGMALMDASYEKVGNYKHITFSLFIRSFLAHFKRIIVFGMGSLILIVGCILPYWINTKNNPINQIPIPHGSRDNFLEVTSSGLVFFVIPWGILLLLFPYFFYRFYSKRYLFFGLSFTLLFILGTGGTTSIPLLVLGENAFNILTLDRFTLWATIMALPLFGEFVYRFSEKDLKEYVQQRWGVFYHRFAVGSLAFLFVFMAVFSMSLSYFRPSQPQKIDMLPIVNFLNQDQHDQWRYLPLGFGDQMAWLSTQTKALTVDGNYHSARRLPELTTRAVERLENSKYRGVEGIGSLQDFLTIPEKYHLKYVFSNDKFYDPILYFSGWHRLQLLENGIMVWERSGVTPLPSVLPKDDVALFQKLLWGIIPLLTLVIVALLHLKSIWMRTFKTTGYRIPDYLKFSATYGRFNGKLARLLAFWIAALGLIVCISLYQLYLKSNEQQSASNVVKAYYDALDFKEFEKAYTLIDPRSGKSLSQYMLEISVSDGLLSSYAKLNATDILIQNESELNAKAEVVAQWVTPLQEFEKRNTHELSKFNGKWYLKPTEVDLDIPPDQLLGKNKTVFYNHGRRRITSEQTYHEDVLKQPVVEVLSAKLIRRDTSYSIIGVVQNIDRVPADVAVKGTLFSEENKALASYNAKDIIKHKLLPMEVTPFRIDFEEIAWLVSRDGGQKVTNSYALGEVPSKFELQLQANVATTDLYDELAVIQCSIENDAISGSLFNSGVQNATIPQLLISFYDEDRTVLWVEKKYLEASVRPQRKQQFKIELPKENAPTLLNDSLENIFVNGLPNQSSAAKLIPERLSEHDGAQLIKVAGRSYAYISIKLNSFLGKSM